MMVSALLLAAAGPTYLRCNFGPERTEVIITADEPNSTVSVTVPNTGHAAKVSGAFSPTELRFRDDMISYVISRTDLSAARTINMINSTEKGQCKVEQAPKRAF